MEQTCFCVPQKPHRAGNIYFLSLTISEWVWKRLKQLSGPPPGAPRVWTQVVWKYLLSETSEVRPCLRCEWFQHVPTDNWFFLSQIIKFFTINETKRWRTGLRVFTERLTRAFCLIPPSSACPACWSITWLLGSGAAKWQRELWGISQCVEFSAPKEIKTF